MSNDHGQTTPPISQGRIGSEHSNRNYYSPFITGLSFLVHITATTATGSEAGEGGNVNVGKFSLPRSDC